MYLKVRDKLETIVLCWVVLLVTTTAGFIGATVLADETMNVRDAFNLFMQWLAAVGTVGATVTALWFGLRSRIDQDKREYAAAVLVAAGIAPLLTLALDELRDIGTTLAFTDEPEEDGVRTLNNTVWDQQEQLFEQIAEVISAPVFDHGVETSTQLLPISILAAQRFYAGRSLLRHLKRQTFKAGSISQEWTMIGTKKRHQMLKELEEQLGLAEHYLTLAQRDFARATAAANTEPTAEELYGD